VKAQNPYLIEFGGLGEGTHEFEYHIDDAFFAGFENSIIQHGDLDMLVTLEKEPGLLLMDFTFQGTIMTTCDRCLDLMEVTLEGYNELVVRLGTPQEEDDGGEIDIITLPAKEHELDVRELIFEYISLQVPIRNVHPDDENGKSTCNADVLREMEKHLAKETHEDPRWDVLKNINLN
jgi:uncharacterized protein